MTAPTVSSPRGTRRIRSVVAVGVLFLLLGALDVYQGIVPIISSIARSRLAGDDVLVLAIGVAAFIGGWQLLRRRSWARWLLVAWMALHVVISAERLSALGAHLAIFGGIAFLLFRSGAAPHFVTHTASPADREPRTDDS